MVIRMARLRMGLIGWPNGPTYIAGQIQAYFIWNEEHHAEPAHHQEGKYQDESSCDQVLLNLFVISLMLPFSSSNDLLPAWPSKWWTTKNNVDCQQQSSHSPSHHPPASSSTSTLWPPTQRNPHCTMILVMLTSLFNVTFSILDIFLIVLFAVSVGPPFLVFSFETAIRWCVVLASVVQQEYEDLKSKLSQCWWVLAEGITEEESTVTRGERLKAGARERRDGRGRGENS